MFASGLFILIKQEKSKFWNIADHYKRLKILREMVRSNSSFEESLKVVEDSIKKELQISAQWGARWKIVVRIMKVVFSPVIFVWLILKFVGKSVMKLAIILKTLYKLWELFNKVCPTVVQKRVLKV